MASSLSDLNAWTRAVWDHLIQTGEALSAHQITRQWGDYPTVYHSASEMLNMASEQGYFRTLAASTTQDVRYYATRPRRTQQQPEPESYFAPEARPVVSVWEWAR